MQDACPDDQYLYIFSDLTTFQLQSTSIPGSGEDECECIECSNVIVIGVSAGFLPLIVTLVIVVIAQCWVLARMKSKFKKLDLDKEVMTLSTTYMDVPDFPDDLFAMHKLNEKATFEQVK